MGAIRNTMFRKCVVIFLMLIFHIFSSHAVYDNKNENDNNNNKINNTATNLKHIYTLAENCVGNICRNFQYENTMEIAFFDLKMEVHITDESTYDLNAQKTYESLTFEKSTFRHFPLNLFNVLEIKELDMRNCSVVIITWDNFLMASNLRVLLLSQNHIESISEMTFNYASELQYLFLDGNRLRTLVNESFRGLKKLNLLDLSNNRLRDLPQDLFTYMPELQEIRLHENRLFSIGNELFANNPQLIGLTLNDNRLHELGDYAFKSQARLMLLDLSNNRPLNTFVSNIQVWQLNAANCSLNRVNIYGNVQHVDLRDNHIMELYFSQPEALITLNLRNNALQQLASLTRATSLKTLIVADNPDMVTLPETWLSTALEKLDLSNTSLKVFPIASLAEQNNLHVLNVSSNMLEEINPKDFKYLQKLLHFYIHKNNWNCFNLQLIMELLIKPNKISYTHDEFDAEFQGEYMNGIACMYRLEEKETTQSPPTAAGEFVANYYENMIGGSSNKPNNKVTADLIIPNERESNNVQQTNNMIRKELEGIVGFYEIKFKRAFQLIDELNARLARFEAALNSTQFQQFTITV